MGAKVRTILLVSLVTVLIWLWAEGESLSSETLTPTVSFVRDDSILIEPYDDWSGTVSVRLQGSTRALTEARTKLSQIRLRVGQPGVPIEPGEQRIVNLEEAIRRLDEVRASGLSVLEVSPANRVVKIVKMVSKEVPVRAALPTDIPLLGEASVQPGRVVVRMPAQLEALMAEAFATAPLTKAELGSARDDAAQTLTTAVRLPAPLQGDPSVSVSPDKVNVTFRLKRSVDSITLPSVPVWFSLPSTEGTQWNVELVDQFLRDVTFTGPTDAIARIRSREVVPIAMIRLKSDDLEKGVEAVEASFVDLPPGVETGVAERAVRVKVLRRKLESPENPDNLRSPDLEPGTE